MSDEAMNEVLQGHFIPSDAMRSDDFDTFYRERKRALLGLVERVMDKAAERDDETLETSAT